MINMFVKESFANIVFDKTMMKVQIKTDFAPSAKEFAFARDVLEMI